MKSTNKEKKLSPRKRLFTSGSAGDVVTFTFIETKRVGIKYTHDLSFFFFGMPLRQQGVPRTSGAKTKQGELFVGINPLIAY